MSATETAMSALERNWGMVDRALEDVDDVILRSQPNGQSNSIGWLLWHMSRVVDRFVHTWCQDAPQLWVKDSWHEKFGLDADPDDTGQGWSEDQVAGWQLPAKNLLVDYYDVVKAAAREHIQPLSASDLKRQMSWGATMDYFWAFWSSTIAFTVARSHTFKATTKAWAGSYSVGEGPVEP